jgi:hypothetical protein
VKPTLAAVEALKAVAEACTRVVMTSFAKSG